MKTSSLIAFATLVLLVSEARALGDPPPASGTEGIEFYEKRIRPVLAEHCYACHGPEKQKGGLRLDSTAAVLEGGDSGAAVAPGEPERSLVLKAISYTDNDLKMPPKEKLKSAQIADLTAWVKMGAPGPKNAEPAFNLAERRKHWAYQPVQSVAVPAVKNAAWAASPIDRFILAKLESAGLTPAPPADKQTLLRRVTFDLTGLPPTVEEVAAFLKDTSPNAFEKVVDRLLASPHYGERWGRHWLDVVRYADTAGCNSDYPIADAYRYRNWVIQSFNDDKPYDQFVREQVAGDLLPAKTNQERVQKIVATGYLAISRRFGSSDPEFHLTIEDTIDNLGKAFLGLSVSCARCHDHKFDPILARDYYGLYGIFQSTRYAFPGMEDFKQQRDFVALGDDAERAAFFAYQTELSDLDREQFRLKLELKALKRTADASDQSDTRRPVAQVEAEIEAARIRHEDLLRKPPVVEKAYAVWEGQGADARVHIKGEPKQLGEVVPRGFLQVLGGQQLPPKAAGSGRYELAQWLTDLKNPLTARVIVNRIWQHHFGNGLVSTPNDFGTRGQPPSHPELLDWLATHFIENGWSFKAMHKLILLSSTYQLGSGHDPRNAQIDPSNRLHWRFDRRRLDAEEIRDAMLATSGALDLTMGGRHPFPPEDKFLFTQHKPFGDVYDSKQRSVYLMRQRRQSHPYLDLFDAADPKATTAQRPVSTTPLQALFMMNSEFVYEQAQRLSARVISAEGEIGARIALTYQLILGRPPTSQEVREGRQFLDECLVVLEQDGVPLEKRPSSAWASYCRVLLSSSEFIFVD